MSKDKFKINLRENGEHSFKRSLESYEEYEETGDQMLLKDTIMFLHQSIELLMKQMLVEHSPYLIFEELRDIPKKQKEANKQGIGIFFIEKPPRSVTYEVAIDRVEAFLNPPELDDILKADLDKLNRLRNQLEHYEIDADRDEVVRMLKAIQQPILSFFEKYLRPLTQLHTSQAKQAQENIDKGYENYKQRSHEVLMLIQKFNGQKVPGKLFGVDEEVTLPVFEDIRENVMEARELNDSTLRIEIDILAQSNIPPKITWMVEIKLRAARVADIYQVSSYGRLLVAVPWIVTFGEVSDLAYFEAKEAQVMITGQQEWEALKKLVESSIS